MFKPVNGDSHILLIPAGDTGPDKYQPCAFLSLDFIACLTVPEYRRCSHLYGPIRDKDGHELHAHAALVESGSIFADAGDNPPSNSGLSIAVQLTMLEYIRSSKVRRQYCRCPTSSKYAHHMYKTHS